MMKFMCVIGVVAIVNCSMFVYTVSYGLNCLETLGWNILQWVTQCINHLQNYVLKQLCEQSSWYKGMPTRDAIRWGKRGNLS